MELLQDGVLAFLASVGLVSLVWMAAGLLRRSGPAELALVLPLKGAAPALEADVRTLRRLKHQVPEATIVLLDCGLDRDALLLARYLAQREEDVLLVEGDTPAACLTERRQAERE